MLANFDALDIIPGKLFLSPDNTISRKLVLEWTYCMMSISVSYPHY